MAPLMRCWREVLIAFFRRLLRIRARLRGASETLCYGDAKNWKVLQLWFKLIEWRFLAAKFFYMSTGR